MKAKLPFGICIARLCFLDGSMRGTSARQCAQFITLMGCMMSRLPGDAVLAQSISNNAALFEAALQQLEQGMQCILQIALAWSLCMHACAWSRPNESRLICERQMQDSA